MILTDSVQRWTEIEFYYFCFDIYQLNKDMMDVVNAIEAISQIGQINIGTLKRAAAKMLSDPYYLPILEEVVILGNQNGIPPKELAEEVGKSKATISRMISKSDLFSPRPKLEPFEDEQIYKYMELLKRFKKAGFKCN